MLHVLFCLSHHLHCFVIYLCQSQPVFHLRHGKCLYLRIHTHVLHTRSSAQPWAACDSHYSQQELHMSTREGASLNLLVSHLLASRKLIFYSRGKITGSSPATPQQPVLCMMYSTLPSNVAKQRSTIQENPALACSGWWGGLDVTLCTQSCVERGVLCSRLLQPSLIADTSPLLFSLH